MCKSCLLILIVAASVPGRISLRGGNEMRFDLLRDILYIVRGHANMRGSDICFEN
jgi:hypothetical protein